MDAPLDLDSKYINDTKNAALFFVLCIFIQYRNINGSLLCGEIFIVAFPACKADVMILSRYIAGWEGYDKYFTT